MSKEPIYEVKFHKKADTKLTADVHDVVKSAVTIFVDQSELTKLQRAWLGRSPRKCIVKDRELIIGLDLDKYETFTCKQTPVTGVFSAENHRLHKEEE